MTNINKDLRRFDGKREYCPKMLLQDAVMNFDAVMNSIKAFKLDLVVTKSKYLTPDRNIVTLETSLVPILLPCS